MDHVGADAQALYVVDVVQVVFQIELGEPEGDEEGGVVGGAGGCVEEGDDEVGSVVWGGEGSVWCSISCESGSWRGG